MRILLTIYWCCFLTGIHAQTLTGKVFQEQDNQQKEPLIGASVYWQGDESGTTTDINGAFELPFSKNDDYLIISYIGFQSDTLKVDRQSTSPMQVTLKASVNLNEVEVAARQPSTQISLLETRNMEKISSKELQKAACCNLSESFETNATVDVNFTDAVSGSKKIQMLGLDGIYSQFLFENIPTLRGLSASRGLAYVPGTWIESIQVTKGSGSVVNGYESMTGQINLELIKPDNSDRLFVNLYGNQQGRKEANVHFSQKLGEKWSTGLLMHGSDLNQKNDHNKDEFLDMPLRSQLNVLNRWKFNSDRYKAQFGFRAVSEESTGGQKSFDPSSDIGTRNAFGVGIDSKEAEVFFKNGLVFPQAPTKSVALIGSARRSEQDYYFGERTYQGNQNTLYFNLIYQSSFINDNHSFKIGSSYLMDEYEESFNDSTFNRNEIVPGVYGEYTFSYREKVSLVTGMRADEHNLFGTLLSPRLHAKYNLHPLTAIRLSAGRGYRTANIYAENAVVLASSRKIIIEENPLQEISWNTGLSLTHKFKLFRKETYLNIDYFRTQFENQLVIDLENPDEVRFYNLEGTSYSNSFQVDAGIELITRLDLKVAGKIYDVKTTYDGDLKEKPLVKNTGGLINLGYMTKNENWKFDVTGHLYGSSRLPNTSSNPAKYQIGKRSSPYQTFHAQITRVFKHLELYLGGENLTNFRQPNAIVAAEDPFGPNFDASMIWGPIAGRTIYAGLRLSIQ